MQKVDCGYCGSEQSRTYGIERSGKGLHPTWVECLGCGLLYANPRAECDEIREYYANYYEKGPFESYLDDKELEAVALNEAGKMISRIAQRVPSGVLVDTGFGAGFMVAAAVRAGYEVWGNDLSPETVDHAVKRWGLPEDHFRAGNIEEANFDSEMADCLFAWHIIEHVLDLHSFMKEITRILKPGGLLVMGTENNLNLHNRLDRLGCFLRRRVPPPPTATEHTFGFTNRLLRRLLEDYGFRIISFRAYEDNWMGAYLRPPRSKHVEKRIVQWLDLLVRRYPLYWLSQFVDIGQKIEVFAVKPPA